MDIKTPQEIALEKIQLLSLFKEDIRRWFDGKYTQLEKDELRSRINRSVRRIHNIVKETGCLKLITAAPPASVGGLMLKGFDPFDNILESYYGLSFIPSIVDMIDEAIGVLESPEYLGKLLEKLKGTEQEIEHQKTTIKALQQILLICRRFHLLARQLQDRHAGRSTLVIEDEYDVQDLFASLLRLDFDDVRKEEWTPSYAGKSARVDFLLKRENIVVEIKKTRASLGIKELGDQLIIDIGRYKIHDGCSTLICFVYDPEFRIRNPAELEDDLSGLHDRLDVRVVVAPGTS
jgi:hypothetical protein